MNIFSTSFYGSCLWDIFSSDCEKLYRSWNVAIRQAFKVDRCTHRYLIEAISNTLHPKTMLSARYATFYRSLVSSTKFSVRLLVRLCEDDNRTVMGRTLDFLCRECNISDHNLLSASLVKKYVKYFPIPDEERWRDNCVNELLQIRNDFLSLPGFSIAEINLMLDHVCTS